jgi:hypothetical protein
MMTPHLTPARIAVLDEVGSRLSPADRALALAAASAAPAPATAASTHWDIAEPARQVEAALIAAGAAPLDNGQADVSGDLRRALIAIWLKALPERIAAARLPPEVLALYPWWLEKLVDFLNDGRGDYPLDFWIKDVRFALALSVPGARSQILDLSWPMGPGETVRHVMAGHGVGPLVAYLRHNARRPWLQNHTESRWLDDFNPEGWARMWATAGALLKTRPHLAGAMGASWFYDPQLETVSPRLNYLRADPVAGGAWLVHQGPGPGHTERATATSPTRRAMVEAGEYTPRSWLLAWPRARLIPWADAWAAEQAKGRTD